MEEKFCPLQNEWHSTGMLSHHEKITNVPKSSTCCLCCQIFR